jgi:DNA-binding MarR family transcriptional regulator
MAVYYRIVDYYQDAKRFDDLYRRLWAMLARHADEGLPHRAREALHHVPARDGISLSDLAKHLALPRSSTSVLVKELGRRGLVTRARDPADERKLAIVLTGAGARLLAADSVLQPERLAAALGALPPPRRAALLQALDEVATAAEERRGGPGDTRDGSPGESGRGPGDPGGSGDDGAVEG